TQDVWNNSMAAARNSDAPDAAAANPLAARIDAEIGYGMPVAWFGDGAAWFSAGLLTPYSALRAGDDRRDYRLGVKWSSAARLDLDLSARRLDGDRADTLIALDARLLFYPAGAHRNHRVVRSTACANRSRWCAISSTGS
ncbi:MAG: hypothetical protein OXU22_05430, partial [Gammaproteobacteria bacterium]|nr:hypothetical protein [Gammaproteobacteria bacterium]